MPNPPAGRSFKARDARHYGHASEARLRRHRVGERTRQVQCNEDSGLAIGRFQAFQAQGEECEHQRRNMGRFSGLWFILGERVAATARATWPKAAAATVITITTIDISIATIDITYASIAIASWGATITIFRRSFGDGLLAGATVQYGWQLLCRQSCHACHNSDR